MPKFIDPFVIKLSQPIRKEIPNKTTLNGLSFAVKSIIAVATLPSNFGNLSWDSNHATPNKYHASCIETLLNAGAILQGTLHTSEFAFDITGVNAYGIPVNPKVNNGMPGGSSSGCVSAVASNLIDFALGTDTGGSIRIPAAYCGVWSLRPTNHLISTEGVLAVGKEYDTVGIIAKNADILTRVSGELLPNQELPLPLKKIYVIKEAIDLCNEDVKHIFEERIEQLNKSGIPLQMITMDEITEEQDPLLKGLNGWRDASILLLNSTWKTLGQWIEKNIPDWRDNNDKLTSEVRENFN